MRDELLLAHGLGANLQELLPDGDIDRQFGRHVIRERYAAVGFKTRRLREYGAAFPESCSNSRRGI